MTRRSLLALLGLMPIARISPAAAAGPLPPGAMTPEIEALRNNWRTLLAKDAKVAADATPVTMSAEAWKKLLASDSYVVLREQGTERPFSSRLNGEKRNGVYVCAGCSLPVFTSAMKFDSGTGWPSFFTTIPDAFGTSIDHKILYPRIEYHCAKCGGHHGHVFDDGPRPTFQRWCNNGVALRFIPA